MGEGGCCGKGARYVIKGALRANEAPEHPGEGHQNTVSGKARRRGCCPLFLAEKTSLIWNEGFGGGRGKGGYVWNEATWVGTTRFKGS